MKRSVFAFLLLLIALPLWAADTKVVNMTAESTPTSDMLLYMIKNPGGTPLDRKVTMGNFALNLPGSVMTATSGAQLILKYNTGDYVPFTVNSFGSLTIAPYGLAGNINLTPATGGLLNINGPTIIGAGPTYGSWPATATLDVYGKLVNASATNHPATFSFVTTENAPLTGTIGGGTHMNANVAMQVVTQTNPTYDSTIKCVWALNTVLAKKAGTEASGIAWGYESTVANSTDEHALAAGNGPLGTVVGVASMILEGHGSAGLFVSGNYTTNATHGTVGGIIPNASWDLGLSIDGISQDGTGIRLNQQVSGTYGSGIDFSNVTSYTNGAALLNYGHGIDWKDTGGTAHQLLTLDATNNFIVGGNAGGTNYITAVRAGGSGVTGTVHIQGADGTDWATFSNNGLTTVKGVTTDGIKIASWGGYSGNAYVCVSLVTGNFYASGVPCP